MPPRRRLIGLIIATLAGLGMLALAFVPGWLDHYRILLGEGPRRVNVLLRAWDGVSVPVLAVAVVLVAAGALGALVELVGRARGEWARPATAWIVLPVAIGLAGLVGSVPEISQQGHASGVTVTADWALGIGIGLAVVSLLALLLSAPLSRRILAVGLVGVIVVAAGTWGGRQLQLDLVEGNGEHFSEGSYTRTATAGQPTETLTLRGGHFTVGDRWSGSYEPSGRVVSLTGDPACPDARGSYHVDAAPDGGITWERIVDTCANGARAADLTTGTWARDH